VTNASKIKLFVISKNPEPAEARRVQLQGAGYHVTAAGNFRDVQEICEKGDFNLVVVGYSIPAKEKNGSEPSWSHGALIRRFWNWSSEIHLYCWTLSTI